MRYLSILSILFVLNLYSSSLDSLLKEVHKSTSTQMQKDKTREKLFLSNLQKAKQKLKNIKLNLKNEKIRTKNFKKRFENQKKQIAHYNLDLEKKGANLNDLFMITKQEAGDFSSLLQSSMTSTEFKGRTEALKELSLSHSNPTIESIKNFYKEFFQEIIESGKIANYSANVITDDGKKKKITVTRVGLFSAFDKNGYLRYDDSIGSFVNLLRQPKSEYFNYITQYYSSNSKIVPMLIDPTRGVLFDMLTEKATIKDRINQGGVIGYIILTLGALALLFSLYKYLTLFNLDKGMKAQIKSQEINLSNPLGRILKSFEKHKSKDINTIESKLDSALVREIPNIQTGLPMIKLIAAVAPLLGLLGTVTGMIETFQSITLFGTGDPKLMAGGISQALMTTVLGLVVAIPILFIYNILSSKAKKIVEILTQQSSSLIAKHLDMTQEVPSDYQNDNR